MISKDPDFDGKIQLAKAGGPDAIAALLEIYRPWLLRLVENDIQAGVRARPAASDVVQGSILLAVAAFPDFRGHSQAEFNAWLKKIVRNHLVDQMRGVTAKKRGITLEHPIGQEDLFDTLTPSKIASANEDATQVLQAIAQLPEKLRDVLQLRYLQNLSFEDIGQRLDISHHTARRRWQQAIQKLGKLLSDLNTH